MSIWRDLGNSQLSLATAWNVTNTFILGAFMIVALRENWQINHPKKLVPDLIEHRSDDAPTGQRTTIIVPPQKAAALGVPELATAKSNGALTAVLDDPRTETTTDNDHETVPVGAQRALHDENEVTAK